MESLTVA